MEGLQYYSYYGFNFSDATINKFRINVYQEPGLSIITASDAALDTYAKGYSDQLREAFNDLNGEFASINLEELINGSSSFAIRFSLFNTAYADGTPPLECNSDSSLQSAADYAKNNFKRTQDFQNLPGLMQSSIVMMTKLNSLMGAITFGNTASDNAVRMANALIDYGVYSHTFNNGDRAKITLDPSGEQFVVVPGSIVDCNGQLYPEDLPLNTEFKFSTTESLQDFANYYSLSEITEQYNIPINPQKYWACTSAGDSWVCVRYYK